MVVFDSKLLEYQGVPTPNMVPTFPEPPNLKVAGFCWIPHILRGEGLLICGLRGSV